MPLRSASVSVLPVAFRARPVVPVRSVYEVFQGDTWVATRLAVSPARAVAQVVRMCASFRPLRASDLRAVVRHA